MASDATELKYAREMMSLYKKLYTAQNSQAPSVNSHRDLWGFRRMYDDLGKTRANEVIEYFFGFPDKFNHKLSELFNNYDVYSQRIDEIEEDEQERIKQLEETKQRVKEFEAKHGAGSSTAT